MEVFLNKCTNLWNGIGCYVMLINWYDYELRGDIHELTRHGDNLCDPYGELMLPGFFKVYPLELKDLTVESLHAYTKTWADKISRFITNSTYYFEELERFDDYELFIATEILSRLNDLSKAINGLICDNVDFSKFGVRGIDTQKRDREQCTQRHPEILIEDDDSEDTEDSELIDYNDYEDSDEEEEDFEEEEDYIEDIRTRLCDTCSCVKTVNYCLSAQVA